MRYDHFAAISAGGDGGFEGRGASVTFPLSPLAPWFTTEHRSQAPEVGTRRSSSTADPRMTSFEIPLHLLLFM